ncbi:hypothetical protein TrRE_jg13088 [Triparma retinervis]|uniref:Methyltransferase domain-containing protein n=1 Tax=Triparma retinervis TaxID=2557542 RepID=A0A9W7G4V1_9STRA|nr:hypothetical protein TrRE_jg13088 [Triparma retinervis]
MNILDYYKQNFPHRTKDDMIYVNDNNATSLDTITSGENSDFDNSIKLISDDFNTFSLPDCANDGFDVTVALHACGSLSDLVLQRAFKFTKTRIVIVPCCYSKCRAERGSDFFAAAASEDKKEELDYVRICQLCERNDDADTSSKAMAIINELRLRLCRMNSGADGWEWEVCTFDREISPKNYVLVGKR